MNGATVLDPKSHRDIVSHSSRSFGAMLSYYCSSSLHDHSTWEILLSSMYERKYTPSDDRVFDLRDVHHHVNMLTWIPFCVPRVVHGSKTGPGVSFATFPSHFSKMKLGDSS